MRQSLNPPQPSVMPWPDLPSALCSLLTHLFIILLCWHLQKKILEGERNDLQAVIEAEQEEVMKGDCGELLLCYSLAEAGKRTYYLGVLFYLFICVFCSHHLFWNLCYYNIKLGFLIIMRYFSYFVFLLNGFLRFMKASRIIDICFVT